MMIEKNSLIEGLKIEKIVHKGMGLGYHNSSPIFVYQGMPGDELNVKVIHKRSNVYFAEIKGYKKRSDYQIPVQCPVFNDCGGCDWLHISYEDQLKFKQSIVEEFFLSLCPEGCRLEEIKASSRVINYRNKVLLPVTEREEQLVAGMYARRSHEIIHHENCFLQPGESDAIVDTALKLMNRAKITAYDEKSRKGILRYIGLRYSFTEDRYLLIFVTSSGKLPFSRVICNELLHKYPQISGIVQNINRNVTNRILGDETKILSGSEYLTEKLGDVTYRTHYTSFFQVNTAQAESLLDHIKEIVEPEDIIIDAYSGIGTVGIYLAGKTNMVYFLEEYELAVRDCLENCRINNLDNCFYVPGKVEDEISRLLKESNANTIIVDPPRKGVDKDVLATISDSRIQKVIYISCDIATQKRDLEYLIEMGFRIASIRPFDMFPQTFHIENVALLTKNGSE